MNVKFLNSCYNMIALSTCILDNNDSDDWYFGKKEQITLTDRLTAVIKYENLCSDDMSLYNYEVHYFSVDFFRDGKLLNGFSYDRKINKKCFGSLANPELSVEAKLNIINKLKPGLRSKMKAATMPTLLTSDEINAVVSKAEELSESVLSLTQIHGKSK